MATIFQQQLCVTRPELLSVMSAHRLRQLLASHTVRQLQRGGNSRTALFLLASVPNPYRDQLYQSLHILSGDHPDTPSTLDDPDALAADTLAAQVRPTADDFRFFADHLLPNGQHIPASAWPRLVNDAAILRQLLSIRAEHVSQRLRQSRRPLPKQHFWQQAATAVANLSQSLLPNNLPTSWRRLAERASQFDSLGHACLVPRTYLNTNAAKVLTPQQQSLLITLIGHHNNLPDTTVANLYNHVARLQQWPVITAAAVANHRVRNRLITTGARQGATRFRLSQTMAVQRSRPTKPQLYWTLDGWTAELLYQSTTTDSRGRRTTTYSNRLCLEVVLDPFCDYPVGYAIGTHETPELVRQALLDALRHIRELTRSDQYIRVHQLQSDRYAIKALLPAYAAVADIVTPAAPHNARAKVVEPYFNHLNRTYCQLLPNWSGFGVTTDPERQPNAEALNLLRHSFPDADGVREQLRQIIAAERAAKHQRFSEALATLTPQQRIPVDRQQFLRAFGRPVPRLHQLTRQGVILTTNGQTVQYDTTDLAFRQSECRQWQLYADPDDPATVLACSPDDREQFLLQRKYVQPMALADRQPGDAEQLGRVRQFNSELEQYVISTFSSHTERAYQTVESLPADPQLDILRRLLITDSHGQHKDRLSQARLAVSAPEPTDTTDDNPFSQF